jgi:hypothetical protein
MFYFRELLFMALSDDEDIHSPHGRHDKIAGNAEGEDAAAFIFNTLLFLTSDTVRRASSASSLTPACCRCYNRT